MKSAGTLQGLAASRVELPELPDDCRRMEARVRPQAGEKWRGVYLRADTARRKANARVGRCADNYDALRQRLGGEV